MTSVENELVIKDESGNTVATMSIQNGELNGLCEWFDGKGELISVGLFKHGQPWSGTFLNWDRFLASEQGSSIYSMESYYKDWITFYESQFDSEEPDYEPVVETYCRGKRMCP